MKLSEKIYYCRKKSGKSQEALAEQFEAAGLPTFLVGSAETPGRIAGAVRSGFEKAWVFQAE